MPYTPVRDIELIEVGSLGKETLSNDSFTNLSLGISGAATIPLSATDVTLTEGTNGQAQHFVLILVGILTANVTVIVPAESRVYVADNRTTGAFTVTFRPASGGGVAVDQSARTLIYCDGTTVYPVASGTGGGGGGSGAPTDASYLVGAAHALLSGERVVTNTPTITWDLATAGQAKALIPPDAVSYTHLQNVSSSRILGRFTGGAGDVQEITPGAGLTLDAGTGVLSATAVGQPLDATLTALAGLATGANQLPYATGTDTFMQTTLTPFARTLLDDIDAPTARGTLGAQASDATLTAFAGVTTGADTLPFFTGIDTASTTTLTAFMRGLLDDPDAATARSTLGVTGGGGGSSDFLGLSDTPDSYAGQAGKGVVVNGLGTGLDFTTAATGSYDLGLTWSGTLPASQVLLRYPFPRAVDFPAGLTGSQGRAAVAATALTTLDLRKNGTSVGSVQWAAAGTTATFVMASATSFAVGDVLTVHAPASADATLADLGLALAGTRAVVAGEMGATTWLGLTDTPDAYAANALKILRVNAGATATEYGPVLGTLAQQNANAVAITGGSAAFTGNLSATGTLYAGGATTLQTTLNVGGNAAFGAINYLGDPATSRTALGLGTMAQQNANAVAITGGSASFGGHAPTGVLDVQNNVVASDVANTYHGVRVWPTYPSGAIGGNALRIEPATGAGLGTMLFRAFTVIDQPVMPSVIAMNLLISDGTGRYNLYAPGTAPNYCAGNVSIGMLPTNTARLEVLYPRALLSGMSLRPDADTGPGNACAFFNAAGTFIGSISTTATATAYNTSSDVRLKHAVEALTGALDLVRRLRPVSFLWNADGSPGRGFLAHELQREIPDAVTGEPDAVNDDGSVKPQQVDHSRLVPWLTAALQEAVAQIQGLTARVATLEAQLA
jgi:hypothetical protein